MDKIQRIHFWCKELDDIKDVMIHIVYRLTQIDFIRKGDEEGFDSLLETGWKEIIDYKNLIRKIYIELETTQPGEDFSGTHQEWLLFRRLFLSVMKDVEIKGDQFFHLFHALRNRYGIIDNDDKNSC